MTDRDVTLSYVGQLHEAFTEARTYAGRVLTLILLVSILIIAVAADPEPGTQPKVTVATLQLEVWALMVGGSLFLVLAPGVAIGRMIRMTNLQREIQRLYRSLDTTFPDRTGHAVDPYDKPGLLAESLLARERAGSPGEWWHRASDRIGAAAAPIVLIALPLAAQVLAVIWWVHEGPGRDGLVIAAGVLVVLATAASFWIAYSRMPDGRANDRWDHPVMDIATDRLAQAYHQRRCEFVSEERIGDWRLKLYGLARPETGVRPELVEATRALAAESLPAVDDDHHGAAFAIAHDARWPIALVYWWEGENELHARIYAGSDPAELSPAGPTALGCVWELGVVEFERRAWIDDVIGNPKGPDIDGYMARRFEGMV